MGACDFQVTVKAKTAQEAFRKAVDDALYECGHGGYSGTIAEKHEFVLAVPPRGKTPLEALILWSDWTAEPSTCHPAYEDKWGPAGCLQTGPEEFTFFGTASS